MVGLSQRARDLLSSSEGARVDFKRTIEAITPDDLCAFANLPEGGTILAGVDEEKSELGTSIGKPIGCSISDSSQLTLVNKAQQCHPPIALSFHPERDGGIAFLRIELPPSATRPHCTPGGRYVARVESRNVALLPHQLLEIFLQKEAGLFEQRFGEAASVITKGLTETEERIADIQRGISDRIDDVANQLGWADSMYDDTGDKIDTLEALVRFGIKKSSSNSERLKFLAIGTKSRDPVKERALETAREEFKDAILSNSDKIRRAPTSEKLSFQVEGELAEELDTDELQKVFDEVFKELLPVIRDGVNESNAD